MAKGKRRGAGAGKRKRKSAPAEEAAVVLKKGASKRVAELREAEASSKMARKDPLPLAFAGAASKHQMLRDGDAEQAACLARTYCGFRRNRLEPAPLHAKVAAALKRLTAGGFFHYDCVQYGDRVNLTRVQRVLVGEEGMTYLYQRLRLFALPWTDASVADGALLAIRELNDNLRAASAKLQREARLKGGHEAERCGGGSCDFNLTLINAALVNDAAETEPAQPLLDFKPDKKYRNKANGKLPLAVNWHKDSTLEPFSTIAVYQHTPDRSSEDWEIAMCCERGNLAPPVSTRLRDRDCYFMLGNFNHHHLHAVIAGQTARYASTHRVAVTQDATYASIAAKCDKVLGAATAWRRVKAAAGQDKSARAAAVDPARVRAVGELAHELEFDWVRMFFCQGRVHQTQHATWWGPRIDKLVQHLEALRTEQKALCAALLGAPAAAQRKSLRLMHLLLSRDEAACAEWAVRLEDECYASLPEPFRPVPAPVPPVPRDVLRCLANLAALPDAS